MEEKRMANHYYGIAGKVREELALDEVEEEPKEFNDYMSIATMVIAKHILECAKELEDIDFNLEYTEYWEGVKTLLLLYSTICLQHVYLII